MGRHGKSVADVHRDFESDFSLLGESLLLCKFCQTVVNWRKRTRIQEHIATRMHQERKRSWTREGEKGVRRGVPVGLGDYRAVQTEMGSAQQYCLRWNNHQNNLLKVFSRLLGSEQFTDVVLAAEGCTIKAHKVVLSACSSYFESLFTVFDERNQIVILKDTSFSDAHAIVEFMYRGEINVSQEQLPSLLRSAENLKVKGLAEVSSSSSSSSSSFPGSAGLSMPPPPPAPRPLQSRTTFMANPCKRLLDSHGGEVKRKRGRPRTLDSPGEIPDPSFSPSLLPSTSSPSSSASRSDAHMASAPPKKEPRPDPILPPPLAENGGSYAPTPGGPLTTERLGDLGVVKMNDYLVNGTRQQFWDEFFVKVIMQAVRNKEIDMKTSAELLGVSYGTLYGRYRETFGYLKGGWAAGTGGNGGGGSPGSRPNKSAVGESSIVVNNANNDIDQERILEELRSGKLEAKQAGTLLGMDETMLAYHLASKLHDEASNEEEEEEEPTPLEAIPDIVMGGGEGDENKENGDGLEGKQEEKGTAAANKDEEEAKA